MSNRVFVCDDAAFMRMMIKDILTKNGYNVIGEAENGRKAVEEYRALSPDLVLMDITMPEMDGIEALKEIMKIDADAKIVMCSTVDEQAAADGAVQSGARGFITKPFRSEELIKAVKKVIG